MKSNISRNRLLIIFAAIVLIAFFAIQIFIYLQKPILLTVTPQRASAGSIVSIEGKYLGEANPRNFLSIGDQRITSSYFIEWRSDRISFRLPEGIRSGNIVLTLPQGRSNELLLTNVDTIPRPVVEPADSPFRIESIANSNNNGWKLSGSSLSQSDMKQFKTEIAGYALPVENFFELNDGSIGFYLPSGIAAGLTESGQLDGEFIGSAFSMQERYPALENSLLQIISGGNKKAEILYSTLAAEVEDPATLLFGWLLTLDFPDETGTSAVLELPIPIVQDISFEIQGRFEGHVQLLSTAHNLLRLRVFPAKPGSEKASGEFEIRYFGTPESSYFFQPDLLEADDDYTNAEFLRPLFGKYLETEADHLLSQEIQDDLVQRLSATRGALPLARGMYVWVLEHGFDPRRSIEIMQDELRRLGIASRIRQGMLFSRDVSTDIIPTQWLEIFIPKRGWIRIHRESIAGALPFGRREYSYIPLPLTIPFPDLDADSRRHTVLQTRLLPRGTPDQ